MFVQVTVLAAILYHRHIHIFRLSYHSVSVSRDGFIIQRPGSTYTGLLSHGGPLATELFESGKMNSHSYSQTGYLYSHERLGHFDGIRRIQGSYDISRDVISRPYPTGMLHNLKIPPSYSGMSFFHMCSIHWFYEIAYVPNTPDWYISFQIRHYLQHTARQIDLSDSWHMTCQYPSPISGIFDGKMYPQTKVKGLHLVTALGKPLMVTLMLIH